MLLFSRDRCPLHRELRCERCRCATCRKGYILESTSVDYCSRRYAKKDSCDGWYTRKILVSTEEGPPEPPTPCIACRFAETTGDKAFLGGVAVAKLFSDKRTGKALVKAFTEKMCPRHEEALKSLKDLRLLHLSEAIISCYDPSSS